jgi:hypothetical protein
VAGRNQKVQSREARRRHEVGVKRTEGAGRVQLRSRNGSRGSRRLSAQTTHCAAAGIRSRGAVS